MPLTRRAFLFTASASATAAGGLLGAAAVHAADYPQRTVSLVVGYPPGGLADVVGRLAASGLTARLGQSVVVDNKPGAAGTVAGGQVARAKPDGYTLFLGTVGEMALAPNVYGKKLQYNPELDFVPITLLVRVPGVLVVSPTLPVRDVKELVAYAKSKPGVLNYASYGMGTTSHLSAEMFKKSTGTQIEHIQYKGSAPALIGMRSGEVQVMFDTLVSAYPHIKAGTLRALALSSEQRVDILPELPTLQESGLENLGINPWLGVVAPKGTPEDVVSHLSRELSAFLATPSVRSQLTGMGMVVADLGRDRFGTFIGSEIRRVAQAISQAGIKLD